MQPSSSSRPWWPARRLVLGAAFAVGLVLALAPQTRPVLAAGPSSALVIVQADAAKGPDTKSGTGAALPALPALPPVPPVPGASAPERGGTTVRS